MPLQLPSGSGNETDGVSTVQFALGSGQVPTPQQSLSAQSIAPSQSSSALLSQTRSVGATGEQSRASGAMLSSPESSPTSSPSRGAGPQAETRRARASAMRRFDMGTPSTR